MAGMDIEGCSLNHFCLSGSDMAGTTFPTSMAATLATSGICKHQVYGALLKTDKQLA